MRICRLVLENFGSFRGRTEIDLAPRKRYRKTRPVILIGGTNGAGKTTILEAIRLCLYGPLALGERVSQEQYHSYLRNSVHRDQTGPLPLKSACVGLEFEYGLAGRIHQFSVERAWDCNNSRVTTELSITRDGAPVDELERAHADEFLRDLIPPGVSQLFFFDGEKIQEMAQASDDDTALADAIKGLLGLDLLGRLQDDLSVYVGRLPRKGAGKTLKKELRELDGKIEAFQKDRLSLTRAVDQSHSRQDRIRREIARIERKLTQVGGGFANEREGLKVEEGHLGQTISEIEKRIRDLCSDLMPFTFASQLCGDLRDHIDAEKTLQDWQTHQEILLTRISDVKQEVEGTLFPPDEKLRISGAVKQRIVERAQSVFDDLGQAPEGLPDVPLIHRLSEDDRDRILLGLHRILNEIPKELSLLEGELELKTRRLVEVRGALKKIPADDVLEPLVKELNSQHRKLGKAEAETKQREEELKSLDHQTEVCKRTRLKKQEEVGDSKTGAERRQMVSKVQSALDEYSTELKQSKVAELSRAVEECLSQLWRKGDALHQIKIDPETCSVMLLNKRDQVIPKEQLSAGEKQIYAISMLWALARVSGRVLPMVIDTPLARLDSKHRHHLVTRYFPHVSHQVVILSTDTEIDQTYFEELSPSISHAYHLRFDDDHGRTIVDEGYFWGRKETEVVT